ncbi:isocitrate lyase/PEP mutase family protein [Streptomyces sp. NPDC003299]
MTSFAALHRAGEPLLLPCAWDHASAYALAARGFPAIGTTSLGVAAAAGLPDAAAATREETLRLALLLGSGPFLLTVDVEGGFSDDPEHVGLLAQELWAVGVAGINLEDGRGSTGRHAAKIAAVKAAVPGLFVNARTDTHWPGGGSGGDAGPSQTLRRLERYQEAGADGVFVPGLADPAAIAALVRQLSVPLNILYTPGGPSVDRLTDLGVRRISLGSLLYRQALGAAVEAAVRVRAGRTPEGTALSYDTVQALTRPPSG